MLDLNVIDDETNSKLQSRRMAIEKAGRFGAKVAAATLPVVLTMLPRIVKAQTQSAVDVLNYALTLEHLEASFYNIAIGNASNIANGIGAVTLDANAKRIVDLIAAHETAHVKLLRDALVAANALTAADPTVNTYDWTAKGNLGTDKGAAFADQATFLTVAQAFEDTGVRAYKGRAGELVGDMTYLPIALSIHSVEARHAAAIRMLRGQKGWVTGGTSTSNGTPAFTNGVYAASATSPGEDNTTQAGVDLKSLSALSTYSAGSLGEAFDEPLEPTTVLAIAGLFLK
ncbi:MAG: ferritin-like domain-containing protein [Bacteroidota bacterium]